MLQILLSMAIILPPDYLLASAPADCRTDAGAECRAIREKACRRDIDAWTERLAGQVAAADLPRLEKEARARISQNRREGVSECQTYYELNGGRDRCKFSDTASCQVEKQRRCGAAIDGFLQQVEQTERAIASEIARSERKPPDFKGRVRDNRRRGVDDCQTWSELAKMAATQ